VQELRGKNAVVTAAASGIGQGIALALAREGTNLALIDIDAGRLAATAEAAGAFGVKVVTEVADVSERASLQAAAERVGQTLGPVQLVCSNAGVGLRSPLLETTEENFDWLIAVNLIGTFNVFKAFVPAMVATGQPGHLMITASLVSLFELPGSNNGVYTATKMAVLGLATSLRAELEPHRVGVSALFPGLVNTNTRQGGRYRPQRFGGPFERPDSTRSENGMSPDEIGRIVVRGIQDNTFLVQSHPVDGRKRFLARQQPILDSFDHWERVIPELGISLDYPAVP
jgi:NAD(P)-dependent dehydrogenase (short-subunit alcohol dehydrogenase family)